jgi:O-antigen ligase
MNMLRLKKIPEFLLYALVILLPWQARWIATPGVLNGEPWEYGTVSVYAIDLLIAFFLVATSIAHMADRKRVQLALPHGIALFLLMVALLSMHFATNQLSALFWYIKLAEGVALFFCVSSLRVRFDRLAAAFTVAGLVQSVVAIMQFGMQKVVGGTLLGISNQDPQMLGVQVIQSTLGRTLRAYGSLPHPNMLGGFLVVCIIMGVIALCRSRSTLRRTTLAVALALQSSALWMTLSRQAWIALIVALVICVAYTFVVERAFPSILVFAIGCIVVPMLTFSFGFPELMQSRISTDTRLEQKSIDERNEYIAQSKNILRDEWFTGVGIGNATAYQHAHDRDEGIYKSGERYQPVHNIYLLAFVELGIFGFMGFALFTLSLFYRTSWKRPDVCALSLCIIALAVVGVFDHYLWSLHFGILLFWTTAGLLMQSRQPVDS